MIYKSIVIDHVSKAKKMAAAVEKKANEMAQTGWELADFSITKSSKAILIFRTQEEIVKEEHVLEHLAQNEASAENTETAEAVGDTE